MAPPDLALIRQAVREEFSDIMGLPDEEEIEEESDCQACQAALIDLRDQIADLKAKVAELQKRPIISAEPIMATEFDHLYRPWNITYTRPE